MKRKLLFYTVLLLIFPVLSYQCSDPHERFEDPPWLGGTNIETLEQEGNYTHFLALMDRADYRVSIENQLFTLFVPSDSAFETFFQERGISSVEDLTVNQAEELFGQHILINPRSREQLMYEYAWGELQDPKGEYGTLFHRKRTYAVPQDYTEEVRYNETYLGQTLKLYRRNTFIPLWTTEYFEDYFGDPAGSDYLFMYPGSSWSGTQWHDAMVTEAEVRTSSGFIYYIDRVVKPLHTIETYLMNNEEEFGLFYDLAQRYASYTDPRLDENNERMYRKRYLQILDFANEWGPSPADPAYMLYMFSGFIPYDEVLQEFLDNTVLQYYGSVDEAPELFLVYLLQSHLNSFLNLPSKMEKRFLNYFGDEIDIDIYNDIGTTVACSNGVIYTMNRILEPNAFTCVPGPLFYNKNYTTFLYALDISGLLSTLIQPDVTVTLFASDNDLLLDYGVRYVDNEGEIVIQYRSSDGVWHTMQMDDLEDFVKDHIHIGENSDFSGEGFIRMSSDNYVYFNNGSIYSGGNQAAGDVCLVEENILSEKNGNLYYIDNSLKAPLNAAEFILTDPDLSSFAALLSEADLIDSIQADYEQPGIMFPRIIFMSGLRQWTVMAPTNQAIDDAEVAGLIPDDFNELREFIYYHFVRGQCVFDDGLFSGTLPTHRIDTIIGSDIFYEALDFTNAVHDLNVEDNYGQVVAVDHNDANNLIETGVIHKIGSILRADLP